MAHHPASVFVLVAGQHVPVCLVRKCFDMQHLQESAEVLVGTAFVVVPAAAKEQSHWEHVPPYSVLAEPAVCLVKKCFDMELLQESVEALEDTAIGAVLAVAEGLSHFIG